MLNVDPEAPPDLDQDLAVIILETEVDITVVIITTEVMLVDTMEATTILESLSYQVLVDRTTKVMVHNAHMDAQSTTNVALKNSVRMRVLLDLSLE